MADISKRYGTLAKRIVGILVVLIIIPLVIDSFFLIRRDNAIKKQAAKNQLILMEKCFTIYLNQFVESSLKSLESDAEFVFTESSIEEMEEKPELTKAFVKGTGVFISRDQLFVVLRKGDELKGLSISESHFLKPLNSLHPFEFSLVKNEGHHPEKMTTSAHIPGANFALQVAIAYEAIDQFEGGAVYRHLFWLLGIILVVGGCGTIWLVRKMAKPLHQLSTAMTAVGNQDYSPRYHAEPFGFEINALGLHFNRMLESLLSHMEKAKNERVKKELLRWELQLGHQIQLELLPKDIPKFPGIQMASRFIPAKEVTGDFFDIFPLSDDELFFVIADGSDKGISACLYSLIVRSMLRSHATAKEALSSIVKLTNNLFFQDTKESGNFVTAWLGIFNARTNTITYASAGHLPAILIYQDGTLEELSTQGIALGVSELDQVVVKKKSMPAGSQLFLYTDGVIDSQGKKGELFGKSRLLAYLKSSSSLEPEHLVDGLMKEIEEFSLDPEPYDDLTMLILKKA